MFWTNIQPQVQTSFPRFNTLESEDSFALELALPGWEKKNIKLEVDDDILTISGMIEETEETNEKHYRRRGFHVVDFEKSFHLPESIDIDAIKAEMNNGVLAISLPKLEEAQPVRRAIEVA